MRNDRGHTLVELLIVVTVMLMLAALAIPASTADPERKLDTLQLAMQDALDRAQSLAMTTAAIYGVRFDADEEWFAVIDENGDPVDDPLSHGPYIVRLSQPGEPADVLIDSVSFGGHSTAVFDEKGVLYLGGTVKLRCGTTQRWLAADTATAALLEIPVQAN